MSPTVRSTTASTAEARNGAPAVLSVQDLHVDLAAADGAREVVRDVSFDLAPGDTVAIVGESGCGKTTLARAIMGIVGSRGGHVTGSIIFNGAQLVGADEVALNRIRGTGISMVFQDATDSLDPVFTIGYQLTEVLRIRRGLSRGNAATAAIQLLRDVDLPNPEQRLRDYPHQLSGGLKQRVAIAVAIATGPEVLIADEPTTALDVTVQAEVLKMLAGLVRQRSMSLVFVTHDLGVARRIADRIIVMYAGQVVETGELSKILEHPAHPYTLGLKKSEPVFARRGERLTPIPGSAPTSFDGMACSFAPRCPFARDICRTVPPALNQVTEKRLSRCHFATEVMSSADD